MSSDGGPYFTEDGSCYYLINGQPVWKALQQNNPASDGGSSCAIAHSVFSKFESHRFPSRNRSHPLTPPPTDLKKRMETGFPLRFQSGRSQGSDPGTKSNYYRDGLERETNRHGPSFDSDFSRRCHEYHDLDLAARVAECEYRDYLRTSGKYSESIRNVNPGMYQGDPHETRDWHQGAAEYADRARTTFHQAGDARSYMNTSYMGYERFDAKEGHVTREANLKRKGKRLDHKYNQHRDSHHEN
ncbi:hypothetical protein F5Y09DRAFT_332134 [Xylaria sp. FL1042]|nr:hypothetical protein F5Y09DRAFT_332134 [Xylaria sp. FL1042]